MTRQTPTRVARGSALPGALLLAIASTASPRAAFAQSVADLEAARAFFIEGTRLGSEGRWKEARELYAQSLQLKAAPLTRYSLGVAQRETGRLADALSSFRAFLAEPPAAATAPYVGPARAAVAALEASVGRVTIRVEPHPIEGLTLAIDGQPVPPELERPREIDPGAHEIVAQAPGFLRATGRFSVAAGREASVALTLARGAIGPGAHPIPRLAGTLGQTTDAPAPLVPLAPPASPARTLPVVLMSLGGAFLGAGVTVGLVGVAQASHAPTSDGADASAARAKAIAGDVLGSLGIATAAAGLVTLLVQGRSTPARMGAVRASAQVSGLGVRF
jgi:hypothetical protein